MLSEKNAKKGLIIIAAIIVGILSFFVLSAKIPEAPFIKYAVDSLENNEDMTMRFSAATLAASLAISALPGDLASPIAQTVADMNKYFVLILVIIFVEKIILTLGTKLALQILIPVACLLIATSVLTGKNWFRQFSYKLIAIASAVILLIPVSSFMVNEWGTEYLEYVETTIEETEDNTQAINEVKESAGDEGFLDKLSTAFNSAVEGTEELLSHTEAVAKKGMRAVAVIVVVNFGVPIFIAVIFKLLLSALFNFKRLNPQLLVEKKVPVEEGGEI